MMYQIAIDAINKELTNISNENFIRNISDGIRVYLEIMNTHFNKQYVKNIIDFKGVRNTEWGTDYGDLISAVYEKLHFVADNGSNYQCREMRTFISWCIKDIDERKIAQLSAQKKQKLESLKAEQIKIEEEINELYVTPKVKVDDGR